MQLPTDFSTLSRSPLLARLRNPRDSAFVWDADFAEVDPNCFTRLEDQIVEIYPFAKTAGGDFWGYLVSRLPDSDIYLFYRDSYEAEPIAGSFGEFVFRQAVTFASVENLSDSEWSVESAREYLRRTMSDFREFLSQEMHDEVRRIVEADPETFDGWTSLISEQDAESLLHERVKIRGEVLEWRA